MAEQLYDCFFGTITEPFLREWKEIPEAREPYDVLEESTRHILHTDWVSICKYGSEWFGNKGIHIDWGSHAWKISRQKMQELLDANRETEELSDDKQYGVIFIEGV